MMHLQACIQNDSAWFLPQGVSLLNVNICIITKLIIICIALTIFLVLMAFFVEIPMRIHFFIILISVLFCIS